VQNYQFIITSSHVPNVKQAAFDIFFYETFEETEVVAQISLTVYGGL
jgi:hypothetical protein